MLVVDGGRYTLHVVPWHDLAKSFRRIGRLADNLKICVCRGLVTRHDKIEIDTVTVIKTTFLWQSHRGSNGSNDVH